MPTLMCLWGEAYSKALAVMSLSQNVAGSVAELARLADEMWYLAGDKSVDFSWYTKRATLSAVYASTGTPSLRQI